MKSFFVVLLLLIPSAARAGEPVSNTVIGGETVYAVKKGDTLELIGSRLGADWRYIARTNGIDHRKHIHPGDKLRVNTLRIVPLTPDALVHEGIILINIPDRMLYFFKGGKLHKAFPVGLGLLSKKGTTRWRTPLGKFRVTAKEKDPVWHVPESIREEMFEEGRPVKTVVLPGPENPLGRFSVKTSIPKIIIHQTIAPSSVYQYRSHGCIRVRPEDMEDFFLGVEINTPGELIYRNVKIAVLPAGPAGKKVFFEINRDVYGMATDARAVAARLFEEAGVSGSVDWEKVDRMLEEKSGIAEDITQ
ncbi:MAG: L,D-transpeptidase family protein [Thermodesulfovibrionales bacterium]|nr:L,D-transpeptidase family protein [Thermodesulfovibrionales bacterium]